MVLARREENAARIKVLALHGMSKDAWRRFSDEGYKHYLVTECGYKYNMMDLQAAIGIHQLARVEENWRRRQQIWTRYQEELAGLGLGLPAEPEPGTRHAHHLFTVLVDAQRCGVSRDDFSAAMTAENIGVGVHYLAIPEHPYYRRGSPGGREDYPQATRIGRQTVSLPLSPGLSDGGRGRRGRRRAQGAAGGDPARRRALVRRVAAADHDLGVQPDPLPARRGAHRAGRGRDDERPRSPGSRSTWSVGPSVA